ITPHVREWERAGGLPRSLHKRMGEMGYLGVKFPEEYGGSGLDAVTEAVLIEEITKCGAGGVSASLLSSPGIALTKIWLFGNDAQKEKYLTPGIRSEEHTSELQSRFDLVCRLLLEKKKHT